MYKYCYILWLAAIFLLVGCKAPQPEPTIPVRTKQINLPVDRSFGLYRPFGVWDGYKYQTRRENSLALAHLAVSSDTLHLRFWNDRGQVVDIWSEHMKYFMGTVTNYADTTDADYFYARPFRTFYYKSEVDTASARWVYNAITAISNIPSDMYIKEWAHGFDGINFSFETATPSHYSLRTFWSPDAQNDSVKEAKQILFAINNIDSILNLQAKFAVLYDALTPGDYTICASYLCGLRKLSKKEIQDMHLYEDEVRASMLSKQHFKANYK